MHINWIDLAGLVLIAWLAIRQQSLSACVRNMRVQMRWLEIQVNTHEMNIKKLYYFRDVETQQPNPELSAADKQMLKDELDGELADLADRNKSLMSGTTSGR